MITSNIESVNNYLGWESNLKSKWSMIKINPTTPLDELFVKAGNNIKMSCNVSLNGLKPEDVTVEVYCGRLDEQGKMTNSLYTEMKVDKTLNESEYEYSADLSIDDGGNYGYTFRVLPKHDLLINKHDLSLCKWLTN